MADDLRAADRFDAWSFVRDVLVRGAAIEQDTRATGRGYEQHSFRLDAAARELVGRLQPNLAEHPADDDEPVTEEWLREVGFEPPPMLESALHSLSLRCVQVRWYGSTPPHGEWIVMNEKRWEFIRGIPAPTTRGAVRRLLAALNIAPPKG